MFILCGKELLPRLTICSLYILTLCNFSYFPFGFDGWIVSVPDVGILFTFKQDARGVNAHTFICLFTFMNIDKP